jgi:hypothetical protein
VSDTSSSVQTAALVEPVTPVNDMNEQLQPMRVTEALMDYWEREAIREFPYLRLGAVNWPMIVRSLIAEIKRLQA